MINYQKPKMVMDIISPTEKEYGYVFSANNSVRLFLTYEYPNNSDNRNILLSYDESLVTDPQDQINFKQLTELVQDRLRSRNSSIGAAKSLVNDIIEHRCAIPNVSVAIDQLGPVPIYRLSDRQRVIFEGRELDCWVGVYPTWAYRSILKTEDATEYTNRMDYMQSLEHNLRFLFRRYFEDIAEFFFDIENHSDIEMTISKLKKIVDVVGRSINTKLELLTREGETSKRRPRSKRGATKKAGNGKPLDKDLEALRIRIVERNKDVLVRARYIQLLTYFLVNETYKIVRIEPVDFLGEIDALSRTEDLNQLLDRDHALKRLHEAFKIYRTAQRPVRFAELTVRERAQIRPEFWVLKYIQFMEFLSNLKHLSVRDGGIGHGKAWPARIFYSYHFDVPTSVLLQKQLDKFLREEYPPHAVELMVITGAGPKSRFKDAIRAGIWLSHATLATVPKDTTPITEPEDKDFLWISREGNHSLLLGKDVSFLQETGADTQVVLRDLKRKNIDYLAPVNAREYQKNERLIAIYQDETRARFQLNGWNEDNANLRMEMKPLVQEIIEDRAFHTIEGYLSLFSYETKLGILKINKASLRRGIGLTTTNIANKFFVDPRNGITLAKAKAKADYILRKTAEYNFPLLYANFDGEAIWRNEPLIRKASYHGGNVYRGNLDRLVATILCTSDVKMIDKVLNKIYKHSAVPDEELLKH